jgi:hypothetical protein
LIEVKYITAALQLIARVTGASQIGIRCAKRVLRIVGENESRSMAIEIPFDTDDVWEISIAKSILDQTLKSKKEVAITVVNNRLTVKANKFIAEFATEPYTSSPKPEQSGAKPVLREQQERMTHAFNIATLAPIFEADTMFCVEQNSEASYAACFDNLHFALVENTGVKGTASFMFPTKSFKTLVDTAGDDGYRLTVTNASICAWNDNWELTLPFVQTEAARSISDVRSLADSFGESWVRCEASSLYDAVIAASSSIEEGGTLCLSVKERELLITGSSSIGRVRQKIECKQLIKAWTDLWIDPKTLLALLAIAPGEFVDLGAHDNRFLFIRAEDESSKATYASLLGNNPNASKS